MTGEPSSCAKYKRFKDRKRKSKGFHKGWYQTETESVRRELVEKRAPCVEEERFYKRRRRR